MPSERVPIEDLKASAYTIPTDQPESDGTAAWSSTPLVLVEVRSGDTWGLGFSYTHAAAAKLIETKLKQVVESRDALDVTGCWLAMVEAVRNVGRPGIASTAIAAVDIALWDLKAKLLGLPLVKLLGAVRDSVPVYGSGGFTSYTIEKLQEQLSIWVQDGIPCVKMKIGRHPSKDLQRVEAAREAIGEEAELFVDANGAYSRKQALHFAEVFRDYGVTWFEEPVSSDDLAGLRLLRDRAPAGMDVSAGEYGYSIFYFRDMMAAEAVDVLQADVTRCSGVTEFLRVGALCFAHNLPLSAHTAPSLSLHLGCALPAVRHLEYFHDHVRIEDMLFDGVAKPQDGELRPELSRPGLGLEFKHQDARQYRV
jgi:L-alanine-DL-glutamate epimerase-like enolase superfamily enzyme